MRNDSLTENILNILRRSIIVGDLPMGLLLSETALASAIDVSKTPVRESIVQLKGEGLLDVYPQRGTAVFYPSEKEVAELIEYREVLELATIRIAYNKNKILLISVLEDICTQMEDNLKQDNIRGYVWLDHFFHETIFNYCDNENLQRSWSLIGSRMAALLMQLTRNHSHVERSRQGHKDIVIALKNNNLDIARKHLKDHISPQKSSFWQEMPQLITQLSRAKGGRKSTFLWQEDTQTIKYIPE